MGAAATWLEAFLTKSPDAEWAKFIEAIHGRFVRNQRQIHLCRLFQIYQIVIVEDYVQRFSDLMDKLSAYDNHPDVLHYTTRFLDGLKPVVRS
jgi:hypothetical protein